MIACALALGGCIPKIEPQPALLTSIRQATPPLTMVDESVKGVTIEVLDLYGGSRWDLPGAEGRAFAAIAAVENLDGIDAAIDRDHAWVQIRCTVPDECRSQLDAFRAAHATGASRLERLTAIQTAMRPEEIATILRFEGHPYGHPIAGRLGVLEQTHAYEPLRKSGIRTRIVAADKPTLELIKKMVQEWSSQLNESPPLDAAMKAVAPTGQVVGLLESDAPYAAIVVAQPRRPTQTTRVMVDDSTAATHWRIRSCLEALPPTFSLNHSPGFDGWEPRLQLPVHPYWVIKVHDLPASTEAFSGWLSGVESELTAACGGPGEEAWQVGLGQGSAWVVPWPAEREFPRSEDVQSRRVFPIQGRPEDILR